MTHLMAKLDYGTRPFLLWELGTNQSLNARWEQKCLGLSAPAPPKKVPRNKPNPVEAGESLGDGSLQLRELPISAIRHEC